MLFGDFCTFHVHNSRGKTLEDDASNGKDESFPFILLDTATCIGVSIKCFCHSGLSYLRFS